ncbi:unnamed protein product [Discula destructiva]
MFVQISLAVFLASSATTALGVRTSESNLAIELINTDLDVTAIYKGSTDGTPVIVDSTTTFNQATVTCPGICIPEYHCDLYDKTLTNVVVTLNPGATEFASTEIGQIICGFGLAENKREATGIAIPRVEPYDGAAVFTNNETGWETGFAFYLGETVSLAERTLYYSSATVQDVNAPQLPIWSCKAFDADGDSLGIFWVSEKFIYSFVPGIVASFLCD